MVSSILRNADLGVGLLLAVVVAVLSALSVAQPEVVSAVVLALLALVLSVFFRLRKTLADIELDAQQRAVALQGIVAQLAGDVGASASFRLDYPDLADELAQADEILVIAGGSLRTSVGSYRYQFETAARRGAKIQLCCPDPDSDELMSQLAVKQNSPIGDTRSAVTSSLTIARRVAAQAANSSNFEIRLCSQISGVGLIYLKGGREAGERIYVKILPHSFESGAAPVFRLDPLRDPIVFPVMLESGRATWNDARQPSVP